jgi:hypothetical protein
MKTLRLDIDQLCVETFESPRSAALDGTPPDDAVPGGKSEGSSGGNCCCA